MSKRGNCADKRCLQQQRGCSDQFDNQVAKRCPDCAKIRDCIVEAWNDQSEWGKACLLPNNGKQCVEWCMPGM